MQTAVIKLSPVWITSGGSDPVWSYSNGRIPNAPDRTLLLPEFVVPGPRQTRIRQPVFPRLVGTRSTHPHGLLSDLQDVLLRTQGHPSARRTTATGQGRRDPRSHPRRMRNTSHQPFALGEQEHRDPIHPPGGSTRQGCPPGGGGSFPPEPAKFNSMRSGRSSPRSKTMSNRTILPSGAMPGTTPPSIRNTGCCWRWCRGSGPRRTAGRSSGR